MHISYSGADGSLIEKKSLEDTHLMSRVMSGVNFIHLIKDEGFVVRAILFVFGLGFSFSLVLGMFIWLEKNASKYKNDANYFSFISKFSLALFIGVFPACSFFLLLHWGIPEHMIDKQRWVVSGFYALWSFTLFYSVYAQKSMDAFRLFMKLNCWFLIATVLMHGLRTNFFFWDSFTNGLYEIFWIDIALFVFAFISYWLYKKSPDIKLLERI